MPSKKVRFLKKQGAAENALEVTWGFLTSTCLLDVASGRFVVEAQHENLKRFENCHAAGWHERAVPIFVALGPKWSLGVA